MLHHRQDSDRPGDVLPAAPEGARERADDRGRELRWTAGAVEVLLDVSADGPARLVGLGAPGSAARSARRAARQPLVEVLAVGHGRAHMNLRTTATAVGARLRVRGWHEEHRGDGLVLVVVQEDPATGLVVRSELEAPAGVPGLRSTTTLVNEGAEEVLLQAVSSFATGALVPDGGDGGALDLVSGRSEWLGEGRFASRPVRGQHGLVDLDLPRHQGQDGRSAVVLASTGTWSTGGDSPVAAVVDRTTGRAWAWQVEHNGSWRAELGDRVDGELALVLLGPTDADHQWLQPLAPGGTFTTVPASVVVAEGGLEGAAAALTALRRAAPRRVDADLALVFNDYMNTVMGDPTTEVLLPLVDAAAAAGAEVFCIDAGWYDDTGDWWDGVGAWEPSGRRFPGGLAEVLDRIRGRGMVPGLWLEPEVVGVESPVADRLPTEAFLQRRGRRVVEHDRYLLDLRHPAAVEHLDAVVDRLVDDLGVGYFKLDYNVTPGVGTDHDAASAGAGLLGHNRAHLRWLEGLAGRHPHVLLENCGSGAMRMDAALLARTHLQSTSDQQDALRYPPIAAAAPLSLLPEQAASWAYPQPGDTPEEIAFTMVTGLSGRLYLSGHLDRMTPEELALVRDATELHAELRAVLPRTTPSWPLGLPGWDDAWTALALDDGDDVLLAVWHRPHLAPDDAGDPVRLVLPARLAGTPATSWRVDVRYPRPETPRGCDPDAWHVVVEDGPHGPALRVDSSLGTPSARLLRLRRATPDA